MTCGITDGALGAVGSTGLGRKKPNPDSALSLYHPSLNLFGNQLLEGEIKGQTRAVGADVSNSCLPSKY